MTTRKLGSFAFFCSAYLDTGLLKAIERRTSVQPEALMSRDEISSQTLQTSIEISSLSSFCQIHGAPLVLQCFLPFRYDSNALEALQDLRDECTRPLVSKEGVEPTSLFSRNADVNNVNENRLRALPDNEVLPLPISSLAASRQYDTQQRTSRSLIQYYCRRLRSQANNESHHLLSMPLTCPTQPGRYTNLFSRALFATADSLRSSCWVIRGYDTTHTNKLQCILCCFSISLDLLIASVGM